MKLFDAYNLAEKIKAQLAPLCERIEVAGSIRRARPEVGDIDLVILPKPGQLAAIKARCAQRLTAVTDGEQNCIYRFPVQPGAAWSGLQLDLFFARPAVKDLLQTVPGNFGTLLICRTGSKEFNIWLGEKAKTRGLSWSPYRGVLDDEGYVIASETEAEVFKALDCENIAPANRER